MIQDQPIWKHIVVIGGFRQSIGSPYVGVDQIALDLHSQLADGNTMVHRQNWDDDFDSLARFIKQASMGRTPRVVIVSYSWGVGNGAVKFAHALRALGYGVEILYSIDGVYRSDIPGFKWRSMLSHDNWFAPSIMVPSNIDKIVSWRQIDTHPQGHRIVPEDENRTSIEEWIIPHTTHTDIDNHSGIRARISRDLEDW